LVSEELAGLFNGENGAWVEALYEDYVLGRERVPESWRRLFDRLHGRAVPESELDAEPAPVAARANGQDRQTAAGPAAPIVGIVGLIDAYRGHGHLIAKLDPLGQNRDEHPLLDPSTYGLGGFDPTRRLQFGNYLGQRDGTLPELIASLRRTYCRTFGAEFMEIRDKERRDWLIERMEPRENRPELTTE
jgi:2-oxoglutarate dehydrogenase E1 component